MLSNVDPVPFKISFTEIVLIILIFIYIASKILIFLFTFFIYKFAAFIWYGRILSQKNLMNFLCENYCVLPFLQSMPIHSHPPPYIRTHRHSLFLDNISIKLAIPLNTHMRFWISQFHLCAFKQFFMLLLAFVYLQKSTQYQYSLVRLLWLYV